MLNPLLGHDTPHPFTPWTSVGLTTAATALELAASATAATMSLWSSALAPAGTPAKPAEPRLAAVQRSETRDASGSGRSWYRAPYRSPFDPLFWMMPGHPVDHVGDWLRPMQAMASAQMGMAGARTAYDPWAAWLDMVAASPLAAGRAAMSPARNNVIDFDAAYAAYRTAGGHAAAQIVRATMPTETASLDTPFGMAPVWPWLAPFAFPGRTWGR